MGGFSFGRFRWFGIRQITQAFACAPLVGLIDTSSYNFTSSEAMGAV